MSHDSCHGETSKQLKRDQSVQKEHTVKELHTNERKYSGEYPPRSATDEGFPAPKDDFMWDYSDEPHKSRRKQILAKYPQIKDLYGHCEQTKYITLLLVIAQFSLAYYLKDDMWSLKYWVVSYVFGATITHSLFLAIHEITHFLAFKTPSYNRYLAIFANLPIGAPYCIAFRGYHMEHHTAQGVDGIDTDLPTQLEAQLFSSTAGKLFFCTFQIFFYALRPMMVKLQKFTAWHLTNWAVQVAAMATMIYVWGPNPFYYFLTCTVLSGSLHPMAGHFIAEHYVFVEGYETYSYYGLGNWYFRDLYRFGWNVGYHNEHHDFPRVPFSRLPLVREIAKEFYEDLPQVKSWSMTIINFIRFPHIGPLNRVKRLNVKTKSE